MFSSLLCSLSVFFFISFSLCAVLYYACDVCIVSGDSKYQFAKLRRSHARVDLNAFTTYRMHYDIPVDVYVSLSLSASLSHNKRARA